MRASLVAALLVTTVALGTLGCAPRVQLEERAVGALAKAQRMARTQAAYERARKRLPALRRGMSVAETQQAMGAIVAIQDERDAGKGPIVIEGFLCQVDPSPLRRRWLFGYDEDSVFLIGFALEFQRADADDKDWVVMRVDESPQEDCPTAE